MAKVDLGEFMIISASSPEDAAKVAEALAKRLGCDELLKAPRKRKANRKKEGK